MSEEVFLLPDVGEGLTEAEIVTWKVNVGDVVVLNQPLVDIETAKATVELPSPYAGTVVALHGNVGDVLEVLALARQALGHRVHVLALLLEVARRGEFSFSAGCARANDRYSPFHCGGRFSAKARGPSTKSALLYIAATAG